MALAGPRWPDLRTRIDTEGIALVMLVDVSGSMAERDFDWRGEPIGRLDAVKKVFHLFVSGGAGPEDTGDGTDLSAFQGRPTDLIGLVTFATRPETACPLTLSHSVLLRLLDDEQPRRIPGESETNLSDAVALGLHRLHAAGPRRKVLVLLSDGEHNVPQPRSGWTPRQAAQVANGLHVPIYAIDAGGPGASVTKLAAKEAERSEGVASPGEVRAQAVRTLEEMAHITHGQYFQARDTKGLLSACRAIDALERSDIRSFQYRRYHEAYPWFGLAAFALLAVRPGAGTNGMAANPVTGLLAAKDIRICCVTHLPIPGLLWFLAVLPLLGVLGLWSARRRRWALARLGEPAAVEMQLTARPGWRWLRGLCLLLGLLGLGLGMAGPQWGRDWDQSAAPGRDLVVVLDCSRSMLAETPSRLERARTALLDLANAVETARRPSPRPGLLRRQGAVGLPLDARLRPLPLSIG